jgi:hypothetical protein
VAASAPGPPASAPGPPALAAQGPPALAAQGQPALAERATAIADEKPELAAGAAFAAGFLFAMILRRFAR